MLPRAPRPFAWLLVLLVPLSEGVLDLVLLGDLYPGAVCADGSPAGYYWKAATSEQGNSTWILFMESGGWCWDLKSCAERCHGNSTKCGSRSWEAHIDETGVLSDSHPASHPTLRTANKAFVRYCTADAHMGDAAAFGYEFRGARVVQAVLSDLVLRRGLGRGGGLGQSKDLLVFGGGSAGARGAMAHLDYVPAMLGATASAAVNVVGFLDSPLWLDYQPWDEALFEGFAVQTSRVFGVLNVSHVGAECSAAFEEPLRWRCILGEYRMPFVRTPYLIAVSLHDGFQLHFNVPNGAWWGRPGSEWQEGQLAYADAFGKRTALLASALASETKSVFATACHSHAESSYDQGFFVHSTEDGTTMNDALLTFLGLRPNATGGSITNVSAGGNVWMDNCSGIDCGGGCRTGDDDPDAVDLNGAPRASIGASAVLAAATWALWATQLHAY